MTAPIQNLVGQVGTHHQTATDADHVSGPTGQDFLHIGGRQESTGQSTGMSTLPCRRRAKSRKKIVPRRGSTPSTTSTGGFV